MILVFDLDDTLYDELSFVSSGLKAVASYMSSLSNTKPELVLNKMNEVLAQKGRGHIFDDTLKHFKIYSKKEVRKCLSIYRLHKPDIKLWPEAVSCLKRFNNNQIYIVTDGNKLVQHNKIMALGLDKIVKKYFITYRFGLKHSKPSPYCFLKIAALEKVAPEKIIYIGDNVNKDFVGIKPLGFKTIRVKTGQFASLIKSSEFEAETSINSLNELTPHYLTTLYGN